LANDYDSAQRPSRQIWPVTFVNEVNSVTARSGDPLGPEGLAAKPAEA
jgi:hypothetical protein